MKIIASFLIVAAIYKTGQGIEHVGRKIESKF